VSEPRIELLRGAEIGTQLDALAAVRIAVFRDWPYLYAGSADYEKKYLDTYLRSARSLAILVWDGEHCVGASTALPLADAEAAAQAPFREQGIALDDIDYFGESVILRSHRGRGLGVKFFELREAHARELGLKTCAFCAVQRPDDHPSMPADYQSNDAFWTRRGYRRQPQLRAGFDWPDIGETRSTTKPLVFWMKTL
jgi:GNAT superfamily N-acetyltransferase